MNIEELNQLTELVIGKAIEVHKALGPGLLESVYRKSLGLELHLAGLEVQQEKDVSLVYKDLVFEPAYRADLVVQNTLVLELKSVELLNDLHTAQILTYMRLGQYPLGLLLNFNVVKMIQGIRRFRL